MDNEPKELIDLAYCHVTQLTNDGVKSEWVVKQNITGDELHRFPGHYTEKDIFLFLNFARKFELIAFNTGIDFQKGKQNAILKEENRVLKFNLESAIKRTEQLSNILEKHQLNEAL